MYKKILILLLLVASTDFVMAQSFHDTQGKFEVSGSGQATYTLPIAMPPSLKNVGPIINLNYSSNQNSGIAGQGWSINSISSIARMSTRKDIDGIRDGVDLDSDDKLALDGQRLLLKTGTYWADGSTYETEVQSNNRIELKGTGAGIYFIVTSPDGSKTWYGNFGGMNATDATAYYIVRYEDVFGNFMLYNYTRPLNKSLCITDIKFSANTITNPTPLNKILFTYKEAFRRESAYVFGTKIEKFEILDKIEVFTGNILFKKYQITHVNDDMGYQRVSKLQEFNGAGEPANPVLFEYKTTSNTVSENVSTYTDNFNLSVSPDFTGDFDGDGRLDFGTGSKLYTNLFQGNGSEYNLTIGGNIRQKFTATTLTNNKLNQKQSMVYADEKLDNIEFKIYNLDNNNIVNTYNKIIPMDNSGSCSDECTLLLYDLNGNLLVGPQYPKSKCTSPSFIKDSNKYLEGDFNGDSISDVLVLGYDQIRQYKPGPPIGNPDIELGKTASNQIYNNNTCQWEYNTSEYVSSARVVDLNPNSPTADNTIGNFALSASDVALLQKGQRFVIDFNSDGKADILTIEDNKNYKVLGFKQQNVAPFATLEILGQGVLDAYSTTKQILFGDFNGDSKVDIMLPETEGLCNSYACNAWSIYYNNNTTTIGGNIFNKNVIYTLDYFPVDFHKSFRDTNRYYAMDVNKDGKTDIVNVWMSEYQYDSVTDPKDWNTSWKARVYINNIGLNHNTFDLFGESPSYHDNDDPVLPIAIVSPYKYKGLDNQLLIARYQVGGSFNKSITYFNFARDYTQDNLLKRVIQSNGTIVNDLEYKSMDVSSANNGFGGLNEFYSSTESLNYPLLEVKKLPTNYLVNRLKNISLGVERIQDFRYHGFAIQLNGQGSIGFMKSARTGWYQLGAQNIVWNVSESNPYQRGSATKSFTLMLPTGTEFTFASNYTSGLISKTENIFDENTDPITKKYSILLKNQKNTDFLTNKVFEKVVNAYDPIYLLPINETSNSYLGTVLHGSTNTISSYDNNTSGTGFNYYIGRPKEVTNTSKVFVNTPNGVVNTKTSNEKWYYLNGNLITTEKKSNNSIETLVETMTYFSNGLLKSKTLSATGTTSTNAVSPRTTSYTYDPTNRFIKTTTDVEGMVTTNLTYHNLYGVVLSQQNPYLQTTTNEYDNWGKPIKLTDFLGKSITYTYTRTNNIFNTTQTGDDGSISFVESDALARQIRKGGKDLNGNWVYSSTEYDYLGRKWRDSEPYFSTETPTLWTTYEYDIFDRPIKTTFPTGKIVSTSYNGLIITANDSVMLKTKEMNANGQVIKATDLPGGTINYKYDANGSLLESDYDGIKITMKYDNWNRKIELNDTSAGLYTTDYNAFGEVIKETTPKGTTLYKYNAVGKILQKSIIGLTNADATNITSVYSYDPVKKWLNTLTVTNPNDGNSTYVYSYDTAGTKPTMQLNKTVETLYPVGSNIPFATFTKQLTFDTFGRVSTELSAALSHGKSSSKTITHNYKNGTTWQLLDGTTVVWQANTANARGQITNESLGNGITVANTFDQYGFAIQNKHTKAGADIMTLDNKFDPILGNLTKRSNSMFGYKENFTYDSLDRLVQWDNNTTTNIWNCPFNTTTEAFTPVGLSNVTNYLGKLKVVAKDLNAGTKKQIFTNASIGKKFKIKADFTSIAGTSPVWAKIVEIDPISQDVIETDLAPLTTGTFEQDYTVQAYTNIYFQLYIADATNGGTSPAPNSFKTIADTNSIVPNLPTASFYLDNFIVSDININTQNYDDRGRITENAIGQYNYTNTSKPYQNTSVFTNTQSNAYYATRPTQNITYNAFKAPIQIVEQGKDIISFGYNAMEQRNIMYYGNTNTNKMLRPYRKYYSADGTMEIKATFTQGGSTTPVAVEFITYIGGNAYTAPLVAKSDGTTTANYYLHRDYQNTILAVSNAAGAVVEKRLFSPWGEIVKIQDGAGNTLNQLTFFDRGYTGHQHLESVGLIHMNARLYDPKLHRFLQPDKYIQDPYNTQNYNRYGYCVNNPLKYTDTSGELIDVIIIGASIALATYLATNYFTAQPITLKGALTATFIGALSGAATFGIGEWAGTMGNFFVKSGFEALAHGTFQGALTGIQGGNFWSGFAAGAISSIASSVWSGGETITDNGNYTMSMTKHAGLGTVLGLNNPVGTIAFGTVMGAAGASLTGGNFWQGAVTGLFVSALNHAMHKIQENKNSTANIYVESDGFGHTYLEVDGTVYSYGRYNADTTSSGGDPIGDGVLMRFSGQEAKDFISQRTEAYPTSHYTEKVNGTKVRAYLDKLYNSGAKLNGTKTWHNNARVIDTYNLIGPGGNNCTTLVYKALRVGGANVPSWQNPVAVSHYYLKIEAIKRGYNPGLWGPKF